LFTLEKLDWKAAGPDPGETPGPASAPVAVLHFWQEHLVNHMDNAI
jgi:hypothetical protein